MVCNEGITLETAAANLQLPCSLELARQHTASLLPIPAPCSAPPCHVHAWQHSVGAALAPFLLKNTLRNFFEATICSSLKQMEVSKEHKTSAAACRAADEGQGLRGAPSRRKDRFLPLPLRDGPNPSRTARTTLLSR